MEIVSTSPPRKKTTGLDELLIQKAILKEQILAQKLQIEVSSKHFLAPVTFSSILFQTFGKGLNLVDGILIGYKMTKIIRKIFWNKK